MENTIFFILIFFILILYICRSPINKFFHYLNARKQEQRLSQSFIKPLIIIQGRDSYRYYENGRFVTIGTEMMQGGILDRRIYRTDALRWNDKEEILTNEEKDKVLRKITDHFSEKGIKWEIKS